MQHSSEHNAGHFSVGHFQANKELRLLLHSLATLLAVFTLYRSCTRAAYINFAAICLSKTKAGSAEELPLVEGLLQRVIHLGAPDARANHLLGVAYIARSAWPEASEQLEKGLEVEPDDVLMHYRLAKVYEQQGRSEEMREELEMVQAWDALRADYAEQGLRFLEEHLYLEAEAEFRHLIEVAVKLKQPYWIAEGYHWLGWSLERQQRAEEAVAAYEEAASFGVEHASTRHAMVDLARLNARLGRFDQSASLLDEAIRFEPHRRYFLIVAGDVYEMQGDCDKAIEYYRLASGIAPFDGQAWEKISKCYLRKGDPHQAIEAAQHGLDLNEKNAALHCLLASAYLQLESEDMACAHLREAMQLEPTNPECRAVLLNTRCEDYSGQTD